MKALQPRDKRALLILVLGVVLYGFLSWVVLPAWDTLSGTEEMAAEKELLLQKYRQVTSRKGRYDILLDRVSKQREQAATRVIQAANASLAAVEFQSQVEATAQKLGITLAQRSVLPTSAAADPLRDITMSLAFEGTPQQMVAFLAEVRSLPKAIRVLTLTVTPVQVAQEAPKSAPFSKNVRVALTLGALMQIPQTAPAAQAPVKGGN